MLRTNIAWSTFLKIVGLVTSMLIVPITLDYLDNEIYGIWLTISSILFWFAFFDIGLGNGMRNYLAQAIAKKDWYAGRTYISTTLIILSIIAFIIGILATIPLTLFDFNVVFNSYTLPSSYLRNVLAIAIFFTMALFVAKTISMVYIALQQYAINDFINVLGHVLCLIIIWILTFTTSGNLLFVVLAMTITPVTIYTLATIPLFNKHPELKPSLRLYDKTAVNEIVGKGLGFFAIQITSCLIIFGGSNIIIAQLCGQQAVTIFNIAFKFFNLLTIGYTIILAPTWSAYTDAYVKDDFQWIEKTFRRTLKIWGLICFIGLVMLISARFFYFIWIGDHVTVPFSVSVTVLIYILFFNLNNCATYLLNGLNIIRIQIITSVVTTALYLITILLWGYNMGIEEIVFSIALCYIVMSIIHLYQCRLLITKKATGIWKK